MINLGAKIKNALVAGTREKVYENVPIGKETNMLIRNWDKVTLEVSMPIEMIIWYRYWCEIFREIKRKQLMALEKMNG